MGLNGQPVVTIKWTVFAFIDVLKSMLTSYTSYLLRLTVPFCPRPIENSHTSNIKMQTKIQIQSYL